MIDVVWRGRGILAFLTAVPPIACCIGLIDWRPAVAMVVFGTALAIAGLVCRHYGRRWNQGTGTHTMYWIPLEVWGWIYIIVGLLFAFAAGVGLARGRG